MKLISLNAWGGKLHQPLMDFIRAHAGSTDVFCFQEIFGSSTERGLKNDSKLDLFQDLCAELQDFVPYTAWKSKGYDYRGYAGADIDFGNVIFIRKNFKVDQHQELFERVEHPDHDWKVSTPGKAQFIKLGNLLICNFHGLWINGTEKKDNPERLEQSTQIRAILDNSDAEKIICGDFNLVPEGESIKILEQGMRNLITEYGVKSTRSSHYKKPLKFADYILVAPGIKINKFEVLAGEVSDHLAMLLEFEN